MTSRGKFWGDTGGARQNFGGAVAPPGTSLAPPLPSAASAATCVLCNFTYKLSISTDMIIEIQFAKLLVKLPTESHWR